MFRFMLNDKEKTIQSALSEIDWQIKVILYSFEDIFGKENITVNYLYNYTINKTQYFTNFLSTLDLSDYYDELRSKRMLDERLILISEKNSYIGINFNWREKSVDMIRDELIELFDDTIIYQFKDHRCNINLNE